MTDGGAALAFLKTPRGRLRWGLLLVNGAVGLVLIWDLAVGPTSPATVLAVVAVAATLVHWAIGLRAGQLPRTTDPVAMVALAALSWGGGATQVAVAFAVGAVTHRALYPRSIGRAFLGYPVAVLVGGLARWGASPLLRPPVLLALVGIVVLGLALRSVVLSLTEQEELRQRLMGVRDDLERRVEERTTQLADANVSLQRRYWELEKTQQLLRRSEEYFRSLIENGSDIVVVLRSDGGVRYSSPSVGRILGYRPTSADRRSFAEFVLDEDLPQAMEVFDRVLESPGEVHMLSLRVRNADGEVRHLEAVARNLLDTPAVGGVVVTARDVSDRVAVEGALLAQEAELRQAQKMEAVGRLAGGVAHDFNNILTVIGGHAEYLAKKLTLTDPLQAEARGIADAVDRAARLTRQLLVFSRREVYQTRILDPNAVLGDVDILIQRLLPENVRLVADLASRRWTIRTDPGHLEQVVLNLVVNARDAMPGGGVLRLETADESIDAPVSCRFGDIAPGQYVRFSVVDTGTGIPEHVLDRIFDPFFTTKAGGTGLGLSTVFGIIQEAGAGIRVESTPEGTAFSVYFPASDDPLDAEAAAPAAPAAGAGETLLLVEDEDGLRALAARTLRDRGYVVLSAATGEDALRMADLFEDPIDLLVTDVVMPGLSGPALHGELETKLGRVPVLFMSGYPGEELSRRGVKDVPLLQKPYSGLRLERAVREVLDAG